MLTDEAKEFIIDKSRGEADRDSPTTVPVRCVARSRQYIEDPLSEELLRGIFDGKNRDHASRCAKSATRSSSTSKA